jgi:hypothetical protein
MPSACSPKASAQAATIVLIRITGRSQDFKTSLLPGSVSPSADGVFSTASQASRSTACLRRDVPPARRRRRVLSAGSGRADGKHRIAAIVQWAARRATSSSPAAIPTTTSPDRRRPVGTAARRPPRATPSPNLEPGLVRESSCPGWGLKGFSDEEATQCKADRRLASAGSAWRSRWPGRSPLGT